MPRFVDTSVLVRYLTEDDPLRARVAEAILESGDMVISTLILSEVAYVLRKTYRYAQRQVVEALVQLLQRENLQMIDLPKELAAVALSKTLSAPRLSFGDALIIAQMRAAGHSEIYSFDKRFRDEGITVLETPIS